jgi:hypothetical protein
MHPRHKMAVKTPPGMDQHKHRNTSWLDGVVLLKILWCMLENWPHGGPARAANRMQLILQQHQPHLWIFVTLCCNIVAECSSLYTPLSRRCGAEEYTSAHVLCECAALASLRHTYLGYFLLDPQDVRSRSQGNLELQQRNRAPMTWTSEYGAQRACLKT